MIILRNFSYKCSELNQTQEIKLRCGYMAAPVTGQGFQN